MISGVRFVVLANKLRTQRVFSVWKYGPKSPLSYPTRIRSIRIQHILRYVVLDIMTDWFSVLAPSFLNPVSEAGVEIINLHPALPGVSKQLWAI